MVTVYKICITAIVLSLISGCCTTNDGSLFDKNKLTNLYVADFKSNDKTVCQSTDINLTHYQARQFFLIAKSIDSKTLHDHYDIAPCYIEGTLNYDDTQACNWQINAAGSGVIQCGQNSQYYVCDNDDCQRLFP